MAGLASSIITRTADEAAAVEDIYKKTSSDIVNSFQDISKSGLELGKAFGFLSNVSSGNMLKLASDGMLSLNKGNLADKISSAFSENYSKAKSLLSDTLSGAQSVSDAIKSNTNALTGMMRNAADVYYQVDGIVQAVKNVDAKDLRSLANTINALSGKVSVALGANNAVGGILSALVGEAGALGIKDAFGTVAQVVRDANDIHNKAQVLYQIASNSLPAAVARGDIRSIISMVDVLGSGAVSMMNPSIVKSIAKTDKSIDDVNGDRYSLFNDYKDHYNKLDPNWNKSTWKVEGSNTDIYDLSTFSTSSSKVTGIFTDGAKMSDRSDDKLYAFVGAMTPTTVDQEIAKRYPYSTAYNSTAMSGMDKNPRLVAQSELLRVWK